MTREQTILTLRRLQSTAPWLTLLVLVICGWQLPIRAAMTEEARLRKAEIKHVFEDDVPYIVGDWFGKDTDPADIPREAQEMLRPNAILSRHYLKPTQMRQHLLIVHCSDARDMQSHYPPVCYPSSGWIRMPVAEVQVTLAVHGQSLAMAVYAFRLVGEFGAEERIRILNAFVLPDGTVTPSKNAVDRQAGRLAVATRGVAQIQIITSATVNDDDARDAAEELLAGLPGLLEVLGMTQGATHES